MYFSANDNSSTVERCYKGAILSSMSNGHEESSPSVPVS